MKRSCIGKSDNGNEIVIYFLDNASDVLRVLNAVQKAAPGFAFCEMPKNYMRYAIADSGQVYLIAGVAKEEGIVREDIDILSAGDLDFYAERVKETLGVDLIEMDNGLYQIDLNKYLSSNADLEYVLMNLMNSDWDFNLGMGEVDVHYAWMPVLDKDRYVLRLCTCPNYPDTWDTKTLDGTIIKLF